MRQFSPIVGLVMTLSACAPKAPSDHVRMSGQIETTDTRVGAQVGGRLLELHAVEGARVQAGDLIARLDAADNDLLLTRERAERDHAAAQLRLLVAGARPEDVRQAEAQLAASQSQVGGAEAELESAQADVDRFEALLASSSGSRKQRDDAVTRRDVARQRLQGAQDEVRARHEDVARLKAGARREEIDAARARVAVAEAQIATVQKAIRDATVTAPVAGIVSERLADVGELLQPRAPIFVISNLDQPWANVYVDEPVVPRLRLGQPATLTTDADRTGIRGTVSYISSKAEFTPRTVQTADERSKLVYRVKVSVDNRAGVLKAGMPIEAEIALAK